MRKLAPFLILFALVTGAVTWPRAEERTSSPQHGWNIVVTIKDNGDVATMMRYNPDHEPDAGRQYESEAACKQTVEADDAFKADLEELLDKLAEYSKAHPDDKFEISVGCMQVDDEPESF